MREEGLHSILTTAARIFRCGLIVFCFFWKY